MLGERCEGSGEERERKPFLAFFFNFPSFFAPFPQLLTERRQQATLSSRPYNGFHFFLQNVEKISLFLQFCDPTSDLLFSNLPWSFHPLYRSVQSADCRPVIKCRLQITDVLSIYRVISIIEMLIVNRLAWEWKSALR